MTFAVKISQQADSDLRGIYEYIAFDLQSPEHADKQMRRIENRILSLEELPERYQRYEKEPWRSQGLRIVPVDNFIVAYIPDIETKTVTIIRVMYGRRNIEQQLSAHTKL